MARQDRFDQDGLIRGMGERLKNALSEESRGLADGETVGQLRERIKELSCLYGVSTLINIHGNDVGKILQGVADLLPFSWQYPDRAAARVIIDEEDYVSRSYRASAWRQIAEVRVGEAQVGSVEVCYHEETPESDEGPFLKEERLLLDAIADRLGKTIKRLRAEQQLEMERDALQKANIALKEVLARVREDRLEVEERVQSNVDEIIMPILHGLVQAPPSDVSGYADLLERNLRDIVPPCTGRGVQQLTKLSPCELQISNMIKQGLSTKDIARLRHIAPATVSRHRERIRKKLGIAHKSINLASYLGSLGT